MYNRFVAERPHRLLQLMESAAAGPNVIHQIFPSDDDSHFLIEEGNLLDRRRYPADENRCEFLEALSLKTNTKSGWGCQIDVGDIKVDHAIVLKNGETLDIYPKLMHRALKMKERKPMFKIVPHHAKFQAIITCDQCHSPVFYVTQEGMLPDDDDDDELGFTEDRGPISLYRVEERSGEHAYHVRNHKEVRKRQMMEYNAGSPKRRLRLGS